MFDYIKVDREVAIEAAKRLVVDSIWKSANIELVKGITFPETQEIFEGRVPANADVEKVIVVNNLKRSWQFLFENLDYPIDVQLAAEYNRIIGEGGLYQNPGKLRDQIVRISGTDYIPAMPSYESVKEQISHALTIENPIERGLELFALSSRGQWFNNGNKRTAQMLANHAFLQKNAAVFAIPDKHKERFTEELVNYYESNDSRNLHAFLYDTSVEMLPSGLTMKGLKEFERASSDPFQEKLERAKKKVEETISTVSQVNEQNVKDLEIER
ncbi:hypothetical protein STRDD10_00410 [Streptococcus sp. DD10]|uniref:hypothetical protein n=1 Tax=Streptococcus sp. DD10 TaxID=1777878 RepID=UPI000798A290|nr:hypothetical protein [Streptococcus sp. DD10]KXT75174.1 hypothetical protein STRDD10_00410 [Streptococcus sp. DD10]